MEEIVRPLHPMAIEFEAYGVVKDLTPEGK